MQLPSEAHSLINYGIIFWGNSSLSINVFRLHKTVITAIIGSRPTDPCRELFTKSKILPLQSKLNVGCGE
jgi:hypothetical protein